LLWNKRVVTVLFLIVNTKIQFLKSDYYYLYSMRQGLEKLIRKIILKKYPYIVDFEVIRTINEMSRNIYYRVNLFIDTNTTPDDLPEDKIKSEVKNLFQVLGPYENEKFDGTGFYKIAKN